MVTLSLYPLAFRRRYGDEMLALIEESPPAARAVVDLLRGALLAHVSPSRGVTAPLGVEDRLRASAVLACWIAFAAAGLGFYKTTEDHPFGAAGHSHPLLGGSHGVVEALAVLGSIAALAGALPLLVVALRQLPRTRAVRAAAAFPALFAVLTGALVLIAHDSGHLPGGVGRASFVVWALAGLACGVGCAAAARRLLFSISAGRRSLRIALACGTVVTLAMASIALATTIYVVALVVDAASLAASGNGPIGSPSVGVSIAIQAVAMLLAAGLASVAVRRGWRSLRPLGNP
jgi:hypothetical protein